MTERGCLVANWNGKLKLGVCNGPSWNISRIQSHRHWRCGVGVVKVKGPRRTIGGLSGILILVDFNGGFAVKLINVNGGGLTSGWGITFGRYEEMLYWITSLQAGGGMIDTSLCVCSSQHRSCIVSPIVCVSTNSCSSSIVSLLSRAIL